MISISRTEGEKDLRILGISCYYHDSAAALLIGDRIAAACQEERFTRKKFDDSFPKNAINYCLKRGGLTVDDLDYVSFYEKPFLKFERMMQSYLATAPFAVSSFVPAVKLWMKSKLWIPETIRNELGFKGKLVFTEHHGSHAASSFFCSPFKESAIVTIDATGEWATSTIGKGEGGEISILREMDYPNSMGLLYSAFTYYTGFKVNSGEYKLMGLAPYGKPTYADIIKEKLVKINEDGSIRLNTDYFGFLTGNLMINEKFEQLFDKPARKPSEKITEKDKDIARSIQAVTEEIVIRMCKNAHELTTSANLCLAGGVALNCVANSRILGETDFKRIFVQPAAGDAGGALGTALVVKHQVAKAKRSMDVFRSPFLGPDYTDEEIKSALNSFKATYTELPEADCITKTAKMIGSKKVVGWFQGRSEWGPRALGNRSILADATSPEMQKTVNMKIKFRESFRPFAPSVLGECFSDYFETPLSESPYMLFIANVRKEKLGKIPAVTHVDGTARIQTVRKEDNPKYYALLKEYHKISGIPLFINTSFNVRGEPIVETPSDAYRCFMISNIDALVLNNFIVLKEEQKDSAMTPERIQEYRSRFGDD
ncbi:MAG: carbamoyltransferase [Candidatus Micrarchaeota archaeon]